jgi:hypothetical protein
VPLFRALDKVPARKVRKAYQGTRTIAITVADWVQLGLCRTREQVVHDNQPQLVAPPSCRRMHSVLPQEHRTNLCGIDLRDPSTWICVPEFVDTVDTPPNRDMRDAEGERLPMHADVSGGCDGVDRNC